MITNLRCFDCKTNSPCLDSKKLIGKSRENVDTDVGVLRVNRGSTAWNFLVEYLHAQLWGYGWAVLKEPVIKTLKLPIKV